VVDLPRSPEGVEGLAEGFVSDAQARAEGGACGGAFLEGLEDLWSDFRQGRGLRRLGEIGDGEVDRVSAQGDEEGPWSRAGAVLSVQGARGGAVGEQVQAGVGPSIQIARAAESDAGGGGLHFPDVVDEGDGDVVSTVEETEEGEESGDVSSVVLVLVVEADEGVEDEEAWAVLLEGSLDAILVVGAVEEEARGADESNEELVEVEVGGGSDG
jgi:hypothetical protein